MITYRRATFDDVENIHKLLNDYAHEGLMLPRARNAIYENLRDYIVAIENNRLIGCGALHFVWDRLATQNKRHRAQHCAFAGKRGHRARRKNVFYAYLPARLFCQVRLH